MANVSMTELQDALKRAGLPTQGYKTMKQATPFARYNIQDYVYGQDQTSPQLNEEYKSKIAQIAAVDQRLSKLYGDSSSNMYIENPLAREGVLSGAQNIGYKDVQRVLDKMSENQKSKDTQVKDLLTFFKDLTAANKPEGGSEDLDFETILSGYNNDSNSAESDLDKLLQEYAANQ